MRKLALCLFLAGMALPAVAAKHVTVEQLEQVLAAAQGKPDPEMARQLSDLEPADVSDVAVSATPAAAKEPTLRLNIATSDLAVAQQGELWTDRLDIFLVQRDDAGLHAQVTGQTLNLRLKPATYQKLLREGIPFDQIVGKRENTGSVRVVVVDENSGWMGSVTVPAAALGGRQ